MHSSVPEPLEPAVVAALASATTYLNGATTERV